MKMQFIWILLFIITLNRTSAQQFPDLKHLYKAIEKIDSIITNLSVVESDRIDFTGVFDSTIGDVKGKIYLSKNKSQIIHVMFQSLSKNQIVKYYCLKGDLILIITDSQVCFIDQDADRTIVSFKGKNETKNCFSCEKYLDFYEGLKLIANID
jgi:hypothetical protein